jgi:hypothetical protein
MIACLLEDASSEKERGVVGVLPSASLDEAYFAFHAIELTGYSVLCILQAVLQISMWTGKSDDVSWNQCLIKSTPPHKYSDPLLKLCVV